MSPGDKMLFVVGKKKGQGDETGREKRSDRSRREEQGERSHRGSALVSTTTRREASDAMRCDAMRCDAKGALGRYHYANP